LTEKVDRARQIKEFETALQAIMAPMTEPVGTPKIDDSWPLAALACLAVSGKRTGGRKAFEMAWSHGTGKTWKALREFPERLRRVATEVEQVNSSRFFTPSMLANVKTRQVDIARKFLYTLPGLMRLYAGGLEAHIKRVPDLTEQILPLSPVAPSQWLWLISLYVRALTGNGATSKSPSC